MKACFCILCVSLSSSDKNTNNDIFSIESYYYLLKTIVPLFTVATVPIHIVIGQHQYCLLSVASVIIIGIISYQQYYFLYYFTYVSAHKRTMDRLFYLFPVIKYYNRIICKAHNGQPTPKT